MVSILKLELNESNSPFWLLGLDKGNLLLGSDNEIPCYYKSGKKQYELAKRVSKSFHKPDEVYLISGIVWDNMKSSWSIKEAGSYIKNKGKLIWSANEITSYMEKYEEGEKDMNLELKEDKYPKGVSRDPLPKKGVKVYTSVATPLESKECKFKPELKDVEECETLNEGSTKLLLSKGDRFENGDTTWEVMDQNSEYTLINALGSDGMPKTNRFAVVWGLQTDGTWNQGHYFSDIDSAIDYFENKTIVPIEETVSQKELINKYNLDLDKIKNDGYDLIVFRCKTCADDLKNYNPYVYDNGKEIPLNKIKVIDVENHNDCCENSEKNMDQKPQAYAPIKLYKTNNIKETVSPQAIMAAVMFTVDNWDKLKDIIETFKSLSNEAYEKALTAFKYLQDTGANIKDAAQEIGNIFVKNESTNLKEDWSKDEFKKSSYSNDKYDVYKCLKRDDNFFVMKKGETPWENKELTQTDKDGVKHLDKLSLKESKIVEPVGNPQVASSFVNIDVDLDHMEVSDFIVRLAQAVRSEQLAILEYVALRSANGVTNADRSTIDKIIEEEKNHLAAITTLLYKQILENHSQNIDQANKEFELPKFGMEIFDNTVEGKLQESLQNTVNKLCEKSPAEYYNFCIRSLNSNLGDTRIYYGIDKALKAIKDLITYSGQEFVIFNTTLAANEKENKINESINLNEEVFHNVDELIKELSTDTNYDEIAYHIHCYSHTDKELALKLMDMLFDLEQDASPKECRDCIIDELESLKPIKEDTKINKKADKLYNVEIDTDYDSDVAEEILKNIEREAKIYADKNDIELTDIKLQDGKFSFIINKEIVESDVEKICQEIFSKSNTLDKEIKIK